MNYALRRTTSTFTSRSALATEGLVPLRDDARRRARRRRDESLYIRSLAKYESMIDKTMFTRLVSSSSLHLKRRDVPSVRLHRYPRAHIFQVPQVHVRDRDPRLLSVELSDDFPPRVDDHRVAVRRAAL